MIKALPEGMPNYPSPFTLHPRKIVVTSGLWLLVVETLILNIISQRARATMTSRRNR
jgi:hypothetical protein